MTELPKELTPELLSLVLDRKVLGIVPKENSIFIIFQQGNKDKDLNIDTLTRLMKEWCREKEYMISTEYLENGVGCMLFKKDSRDIFTCVWSTEDSSILTEFEAVLKATYLVAKEKGFIK